MNSASLYTIASGLGPEHGAVSISEEHAVEIAVATSRIADVLYAEQKFDILVENFVELESALLRVGLHYMVHEPLRARFFNEQRDLFNRLLSNFLSAARGYLDFMPQAAGRMLVEAPDALGRCRSLANAAYDTYLGYRVMEGLRNFAQHQGLPVQALRVTGDPIGAETRTVFSFYARKDEMREAKVFKSSVQAELDSQDGRVVDLKRTAREYMSGIADVHRSLRDEVQPSLVRWESTVSHAASSFQITAPNVHVSTIGVMDSTTTPPTFTHLPFAIWEHLDHLRQKNAYVRNLHLQFVSGQIIPEKPGDAPSSPMG